MPTADDMSLRAAPLANWLLRLQQEVSSLTPPESITLPQLADVNDAMAPVEGDALRFRSGTWTSEEPPAAVSPDVLAEAVWYIDAAGGGQDVIPNLGWGGRTLDAVGGGGAHDPLYLGWDGKNYLWLPGVYGNVLTTPDAGNQGVTLDSVEFAIRVAIEGSVVNTALMGFDSTWAALHLGADGRLRVRILSDALDNIGNAWSEDPAPVTPGEAIWLKGKVTTATAVCEYAYSLDDTDDKDAVTWIPLGDPVAGGHAGDTTIEPYSTGIVIGCDSSGASGSGAMKGKVLAAASWNDDVLWFDLVTADEWIDGTDFSPPTIVPRSLGFGSSFLLRSEGANYRSCPVTRPLWLFGTDQWFQVGDDDLLNFGSGDVTVIAIVRNTNVTLDDTMDMISKGVYGADSAWAISKDYYVQGFMQQDSSNYYYSGFYRSEARDTFALRRDGGSPSFFRGGVIDTGAEIVGSVDFRLSNAESLYIGRGPGGRLAVMEFYAAAIWRRALSDDEIAAVSAHFLERSPGATPDTTAGVVKQSPDRTRWLLGVDDAGDVAIEAL